MPRAATCDDLVLTNLRHVGDGILAATVQNNSGWPARIYGTSLVWETHPGWKVDWFAFGGTSSEFIYW